MGVIPPTLVCRPLVDFPVYSCALDRGVIADNVSGKFKQKQTKTNKKTKTKKRGGGGGGGEGRKAMLRECCACMLNRILSSFGCKVSI